MNRVRVVKSSDEEAILVIGRVDAKTKILSATDHQKDGRNDRPSMYAIKKNAADSPTNQGTN